MKSETGQNIEAAPCIRGSCCSFRKNKENYLKLRHKEGGPKFNPPLVRGWFQRPPPPAISEREARDDLGRGQLAGLLQGAS